MAQPAAQGLPPSPPTLPSSLPGGVASSSSQKRKHGLRFWMAVGIGVVALVVIVVVIAATSGVFLSKVHVTSVGFDYGTSSEPNSCPAHEPASAAGFTSSSGATVRVTTTLVGPSGNRSCMFGAVSAEPSGFLITGSNLYPVVVNASQTVGIWIDVQMPNAGYNGNLTIDFLAFGCGPAGQPSCVL